MQSPIVEELAKDFTGQPVKIVKVNVEESPAVAQTYNVMSIPTLLFFKEGKVVEELHGLTPKEFLADKLKQLLA
jgi:thioredoxin 1